MTTLMQTPVMSPVRSPIAPCADGPAPHGRVGPARRPAPGTSGSVAEVLDCAEVVLPAVHWSRVGDVLQQAGALPGEVVPNCGVPLDEANRDLGLGPTTSGAERLASLCPAARWRSCCNTIPSESLAPVDAARGRMRPPPDWPMPSREDRR